MTSTVLAQIIDELGTSLSSDRELHLIKSAHRIINKNLTANVLTDRSDTYHRYVHRLLNVTFFCLENNNVDVRLAAEAYYEHILKAYECYGYPETSLKLLSMSIERLTGARQVTKVIKYLSYYLNILQRQKNPEKRGKTFHQEVVKMVILRSLDIDQTICHQALEKSCDKLISSVTWQFADLKEIADKVNEKLWTTKGHASRTMSAVLGAVMEASGEALKLMFHSHVEKVIEALVNSQPVPVGAISLIRRTLGQYASEVSQDNMQGLVEMLLLMIRDSSNEIAYDAFAALEELLKADCPQLRDFVPGRYLKTIHGSSSSEVEEQPEPADFVDPLVNSDLYEQLQESLPPPKVDLFLEKFDKLAVNASPSTINYVAAFLGKMFLLTGHGTLLKTDRQSKDSMKILAIRVLNVICANHALEKFIVRIGEKTQHLVDIIEYSTSTDDQLSQQAIKFMFLVLRRGLILEGPDCLSVFKGVKKYRYLLEAAQLHHMDHLNGTQLFEFLEIMAFRSLFTVHYDLGIPEITSACGFIGVLRDWILKTENDNPRYARLLLTFQDALKSCIMHNWDSPRFAIAVPTFVSFYGKDILVAEEFPPSLPLRLNLLTGKRSTQRANKLQPNNYDDWRTILLSEATMPVIVKMEAVLRENIISPEYNHEAVPQWSRMHWNSDALPAILQVMAVSLTNSPTSEDCYHGFHVGMAILNWIYRNVFIVRGAAETKEFPFLQHSRTEMDETLGNRTEFRATLDAFYRTIQSSADEKLEQLLTPTIKLMMAAMEQNFQTSTENILEILIYIKILFTLSPISALKLLHTLLRSLLDPILVESLTRGKVFNFDSSNTYMDDDEYLVEALKCKGNKYFTRWGDDMDLESVKTRLMTAEIMEQLEPLITQSLKCFRCRGSSEKEQVLQIMICLMNHKLKLTDADPTECLMKLTVSTFARPEESIHPQLFETLMHFLATANRFQLERRYQKPITAATMLLKAIERMSETSVLSAMKAISFALLNGRFESNDIDELLKTSQPIWDRCMRLAPTETLYTLSLLLEREGTTVKRQELFWTTSTSWTEQESEKAKNVPFAAIVLPLSMITDYLIGEEVNVIQLLDEWTKNRNCVNITAKSALITALYFSCESAQPLDSWKKHIDYVLNVGKDTVAAQYLLKFADQELISELIEEPDFDEELDALNRTAVEGLMEQHYCGSYQDLCHSIVCLGEASVLDFIDIVEKEWPDDDAMWTILVAEFRRLDDDLEHRLDITFRLQDLAEALAERFTSNTYLKLLANTANAGLDLSCLNITQVKFIFDQATRESLDDGYVLRGVRNLIYHPRMAQLIAEDEFGTAKMFVTLTEKVTGITMNDALLASYGHCRVDFHVKGDMDDRRAREIKRITLSIFALAQETNLRNPKKLTKTQSACFRHPILNSMYNIPMVAMKCFNWIPVVEIVRKPTVTCLPPTGHVCDVIVLDDMRNRLRKVGLVTNAQFEVLFTTMQAVIAHTVIGPEKLDHDSKDAMEREARSCNALQLYIATILNSMRYPNGGDPSSGFVLKSPYISELFLQSSEFAHLCNLKSVWKCEPRTAFTTPLERHDHKKWRRSEGKTQLYGICQTPLFSLWQLCGMMPIEFKQHANYHRIDHSASNYFLTSATNIDTISNVKQLMNIFEYWYSQGIGELGDNLLYTILQSIMNLSDFFDDPDLHKAVLRTTSIIYRHEYDKNAFLTSFVHVMFLKSISVLGTDIQSTDFKPGEPEAITMKLVTSGLASETRIVRVYTLAGLLYLVQSDIYESFMPTIDILSSFLEKYLKKLANGTAKIQSYECQFKLALMIKLLEVPVRLKQDKKTMLKLLLAAMRVRKERFVIELIAEGIEQLLCRSNEFNGNVIDFLMAGIESDDPIPFPTDNECYCRVVYRILMVAATRAKVANDEVSMTRIYKALQKLGFDILSRGQTAPVITRTLPFFSICVNGIEKTVASFMGTMNEDESQHRFVTSLLNQLVETAATSKKWSVDLKSVREKLQSKSETLDEHNLLLLNILCNKLID